MSTNYNNYTFSIFKMNTGILTTTSTNKRKKNFNFHSNTSGAYLYTEKKLKSLKLCLSHMATQLQQSCRTEKIFLTNLHRWLSLSRSLCLRWGVEDLGNWALHSSSFSSFCSFSPLPWLCPLLLSFLNLFRF